MEVLPRSSHSDLNKQASLTPSERVRQKNDIAKLIANVVGLSLAGGVIGRLGLSAARGVQPKPLPYDVSPEANIIQMTNYKNKEEENEDSEMPSPYKKVASLNPLQILADLIHKGDPANPGGSTGILSGDKHPMLTGGNDPGSLGLAGTAPAWSSVPLGLGALYGGWKLTDYLMDKRREVELEEELEDVKQRYEEIAARGFSKESFDNMSVDAAFDTLAEFMTQPELTKQANTVETAIFEKAGLFSGLSGAALGVGGTYALLAALLSGYGSHKFFSSRSERNLIEKALKERQLNKTSIPYATYDTPESLMPDVDDQNEEEDDNEAETAAAILHNPNVSL